MRNSGKGDGGISVVPVLPDPAVIPLIPVIYAALAVAEHMGGRDDCPTSRTPAVSRRFRR